VNDLSNTHTTLDINKIPLEQQICLLKTNDVVKEKAMAKLKEMKGKSEDSGTKPRQYLEGLLKIPFQIYKREAVLDWMDTSRSIYKQICKEDTKKKYTSMEMMNYLYLTQNENKENNNNNNINNNNINDIKKNVLLNMDKSALMQCIKKINILIKNKTDGIKKITCNSKSSKENMINEIMKMMEFIKNDVNNTNININININSQSKKELLREIIHIFNIKEDGHVENLNKNMNQIKEYMKNVKNTLDDAVYGHENAKKQIEKIIGQWINGEQDGYCFGFEGPPGVGKTSLAKKGLSNCLKDERGEGRPFAFIAMGGDSNGSTLHGHN
jgi:hypothetical protein